MKMETGKSKLETRNSETAIWRQGAGIRAASIGFRFSDFDFRISSFGLRLAKWLAGVATAMAGLFASGAAYAQGCAMCYTSAAAAKAGAIQALRHGILILAGPPFVLFAIIGVVIYRRRNRFRGEPEGEEETEVRSQKSEFTRQLSVVSFQAHAQRTTDG